MIKWEIRPLELQLQYTWKISRNATDSKTNLIVSIKEGTHTGLGEAAPNVRYGESADALLDEFGKFSGMVADGVHSSDHLHELFNELDLSYALRFAIDSAWQHLQASRKHISINDHLSVVRQEEVATSYTIPIMDPALLENFYVQHKLSRFSCLKLKTGKDEPFEAVKELSRFSAAPILLDPNEAFLDVEECIYFIEKLKKFRLELIEQPMPAGMDEEYIYLKKYSAYPVFLDESIHHDADFDLLCRMGHGVNIKLMKAGTYSNAIRLLKDARKHGMFTMIGCMVESSLGISSGMQLASLCDYADLDSFLLVKDEPFRLLKEENGILRFRN